MDSESVREKVRAGYGEIANRGGSCCGSKPTCCGSSADASKELASHIGYSAEELAALPEGANMGLSCGNPNALAALKPGEVVLDLGSGGGFDIFIAGPKVGPEGRAIGVDMTPDMLAKARRNVATYKERTGLDNVEFRLGEIEHLPLADATVDVIISNCVINLSPDKPQVWREMMRVLKPGGRVAVSDLALLQPLPPEVKESIGALVGCVAGAVLVSDTEHMAREAGLSDIKLNAKANYVDGMVDWQDPVYQKIISHLPSGSKPSVYITSLEVTARKPSFVPQVRSFKPVKKTQKLEVFDPAMCCSTGICGPNVDPKLVQFAADLKWLQEQGIQVSRFNLSQTPGAFVENQQVNAALAEKGESVLPMLLLGDKVVSSGEYPSRAQLAAAVGLAPVSEELFTPSVGELVAIGAAIAANCEPCFKYHYSQALQLNVSKKDISRAVELAAKVKESPHQSILRLADKLTSTKLSAPGIEATDRCCGSGAGNDKPKSGCCG